MAPYAYRRLDQNHEPQWGAGRANFIENIDAVAQAIQTRLLLFEGEWWADQQDGLPLFQSILGIGGASRNLPAVNLLIQRRILGTPSVTGISNLSSTFDPTARRLNFICDVQTEFGSVIVTNIPQPSSSGALDP